jgi:hypothetical protein
MAVIALLWQKPMSATVAEFHNSSVRASRREQLLSLCSSWNQLSTLAKFVRPLTAKQNAPIFLVSRPMGGK